MVVKPKEGNQNVDVNVPKATLGSIVRLARCAHLDLVAPSAKMEASQQDVWLIVDASASPVFQDVCVR